MNPYRIIFFGTPEFAERILRTLIEEKYNVVAVVSQPDRPTGRKKIITPTPVHAAADEAGIVCLQPEKLRDAKDEIVALHPDLILTCAYGQFIPTSILEIPSKGCLNIHPSLLPKYRGGAPIHHAIMNGDTETGVSLMEMVKEMDAGQVFACVHTPIGEDEGFHEVNERLMDISCDMVRQYLPLYFEGKLEGTPQDPNAVVLGLNISREEEMIHFKNENLKQVYDHIRALSDWPVSYGMIDGKRVKFYKAHKEETEHSYQAGEVIDFRNNAMMIACKGGILHVEELQPEGKKRMDANAFMNGIGRSLKGKVFD